MGHRAFGAGWTGSGVPSTAGDSERRRSGKSRLQQETVSSPSEGTRRLCDLYADAAIVIGDTPRDIDCAQRNGCRCVAVATGRHSAEALATAGADLVLRGLTDIGPVLELLELE
jgi:phosphoglycolate phosphatase-like HAD superfamily hydrolase